VLLFGAMILHDAMSEPPAKASLHPTPVVLAAPVERVTPSGRGSRGPYAEIRWSSGHARLMHLCFLSGCALPPALATLRKGDHIDLWVDHGLVWQVGDARAPLLAYEAIANAYRDGMHRRVMVMLPMWLMTVALTGAALWLRRRAGAGNAARTTVRVTMRWKGPER
jgi:hypothetical protein